MTTHQPTTDTIELLDQLESPYVTLFLGDGMLYCRFADDLHVSLEVAKSCVESRIFFSKGQSYPLLVDMTGIKSTTREARQYMATVGTTLVKAGAFITASSMSKTLGNLFLTIDKPEVPTRLFTDVKKARVWLRQYV